MGTSWSVWWWWAGTRMYPEFTSLIQSFGMFILAASAWESPIVLEPGTRFGSYTGELASHRRTSPTFQSPPPPPPHAALWLLGEGLSQTPGPAGDTQRQLCLADPTRLTCGYFCMSNWVRSQRESPLSLVAFRKRHPSPD